MTIAQCKAMRRKARIDKRYKYKNRDSAKMAARLQSLIQAERARQMRRK